MKAGIVSHDNLFIIMTRDGTIISQELLDTLGRDNICMLSTTTIIYRQKPNFFMSAENFAKSTIAGMFDNIVIIKPSTLASSFYVDLKNKKDEEFIFEEFLQINRNPRKSVT